MTIDPKALEAAARAVMGKAVELSGADESERWYGERLAHAAITAYQQARREDGWQPIETAPKDGTEFQAWIVNGAGVAFWEPKARYHPQHQVFETWGRVGYDHDDWDSDLWLSPTHWMPLPAPPAHEGENQ